jgi:hypothetical protein
MDDDVSAITRLKAKYCRLMDTKDWAGYRQLFADDVVMDSRESGGELINGAEDFLVFIQSVIGDVVTVHQCHTPEIDVLSPTTASGIWAMEDMLRWPNGGELHGYGHYHDTYEKIGPDWRIKSSILTRLRQDFTGPPNAEGARRG